MKIQQKPYIFSLSVVLAVICFCLVPLAIFAEDAAEDAAESAARKACIESEIHPVFEQLCPTWEPIYDLYSLETEMKLETVTLDDESVTRMVSKFQQIEQKKSCPEGVDTLAGKSIAPKFIVRNLAENRDWKIMALGFVLPEESRGVLMAQAKDKDIWSAFYTIPANLSKDKLYFGSSFELSGDILSGSFCTNWESPQDEWGFFEINLNNFKIKPSFRYKLLNYPVKSIYDGATATLQMDSHEGAGFYQSRIRSSLAEGVNFSGHYVVTTAGCGSECQVYIITDAQTGRVVDTKGGRAGAQYRAGSRLLIIDTEPYCITTDICEPSYYLMEAGKLVELD